MRRSGCVCCKGETLDLSVYDLSGRRVKTLRRGALRAGYQEFGWDGTDERSLPTSSGVSLRTPAHRIALDLGADREVAMNWERGSVFGIGG